MGLVQSLLDKAIAYLSQFTAPFLRPIRALIVLFTKFKDNTVGIFDAASTLIEDTTDEYIQIRDFKSRPQWRNRVISVPKAVENIQKLVEVPNQVLTAFKDLVNQLKQKLDPGAFKLDDLEGIEDLRAFIGKFGSKFAAGAEKLLGAVALIVDALVTIRAVIDDLQSIVDAVKTVREDLENLDGLFLQQNNPRKIVTATSNIRVGHLHS